MQETPYTIRSLTFEEATYLGFPTTNEDALERPWEDILLLVPTQENLEP